MAQKVYLEEWKAKIEKSLNDAPMFTQVYVYKNHKHEGKDKWLLVHDIDDENKTFFFSTKNMIGEFDPDVQPGDRIKVDYKVVQREKDPTEAVVLHVISYEKSDDKRYKNVIEGEIAGIIEAKDKCFCEIEFKLAESDTYLSIFSYPDTMMSVTWHCKIGDKRKFQVEVGKVSKFVDASGRIYWNTEDGSNKVAWFNGLFLVADFT